MACAGCSGAVKNALLNLEGVYEARVELAEKKAYVEYDPGKTTLQDLKRAVEGQGTKWRELHCTEMNARANK